MSWKLSGTQLTSNCLDRLFSNLPHAVSHIDLSDTVLGPEGMNTIAKHFSQGDFSQLKRINFSNTAMMDQGGASIIAAIKYLPMLDEIVLTDNFLTNETAIALLPVLTKTNVTKLILSNNLITGIGPVYAENARKLNLKKLILDNNVISDADAVAIARALITPVPNLENIGVQAKLSRDLLRAIVKAHPQTALRELDLHDCNIGTNGARALCTVAPSAEFEIARLQLSGNPLIDNQAVDIHSCQISSSSRLTPFSFFRVPMLNRQQSNHYDKLGSAFIIAFAANLTNIILFAALLYVLYRVREPVFEFTTTKVRGFFTYKQSKEKFNDESAAQSKQFKY